jgi:uncharacterized protein YggL (DUF469 family)
MPHTKMKRRLKKKLHLEEFAVQGFEFSCQINPDQLSADDFFDGLIELVENRGLVIEGDGSDHEFTAYVIASGRYESASQEDVEAVKQWLDATQGIESVKVESLSDAYYGD